MDKDLEDLIKRLALSLGYPKDRDTLNQLYLWLSTTDKATIRQSLSIMLQKGKKDKLYSFDKNLINAIVKVTGKKTIYKSNKKNVKVSIEGNEAVIEAISSEAEDNEGPFTNSSHSLIENPKKSKALIKIKRNAKTNKEKEKNNASKKITNEVELKNAMSNHCHRVKSCSKVENFINNMNDVDYYNFSHNVPEDDWAWIDDDVMEREWKAYVKEWENDKKEIKKFIETISKEAVQEKSSKAKKGKIREKVMESIDPSIRERVDVSLKQELKEVNDFLKTEIEKTKRNLMAKAKAETVARKAALRKNFSHKIASENAKKVPTLRKARLYNKKGQLSGSSSMEVKGIENIFNPDFVYKFEKKNTPSGKEILIPTYDMTRRVKKMSIPIPSYIINSYEEQKTYGAIAAAAFFQMLVSNTPKDEDYTYEYEYEYVKVKRVKKYIKHEHDISHEGGKRKSVKVNILKDLDELRDEYVSTIQTVKKTRTMTHEADDSYVRDDWVFRFKNKTFKSGDKMFDGLFDKKNDKQAIMKIANIFYKETANSKVKSNSFTYDNTNPRWEMLEYGYYASNSKARIGTPYGYKHGVVDNFSVQAPKGFVRLVEAKWNLMANNNVDFFKDFEKQMNLDVSNIQKDILNELKSIDPSIDTKTLDWGNLQTGAFK